MGEYSMGMQKCLGCSRPHPVSDSGVLRVGTIGIVCVAQCNVGAPYWLDLVHKVGEAMVSGVTFEPGSDPRLKTLHRAATDEANAVRERRAEAARVGVVPSPVRRTFRQADATAG